MMRLLSRDPERSILGFSREVAREVTQPLWPSRVPLRMSCSVMLEVFALLSGFSVVVQEIVKFLCGRISLSFA